jgi:transcriptional regulator GlxA family with amidase domain
MNLGVLVFPGVEELDFAGPWEMFALWGQYFGGPARRILVAPAAGTVTGARGLAFLADAGLADCPALDLLLVPGGDGVDAAGADPAVVEFVAAQARTCRAVASVCTGAFVLHRAGLLSGRKATTHWSALDRLRAFGDVAVVEERFVQDGSVWTAAGVSAGIDLALALIASMAGEETAGKVQYAAEYYPSARAYGDRHLHPKAPAYMKRGR